MDLQISVGLLFILFTAGQSLSCYECPDSAGSCANQTVKTCPSGFSKCMSSTSLIEIGVIRAKIKSKDCAPDCVIGSLNIGFVKMSSACCNTDQCNAQDAPDPPNTTNGKKCYSCDLKSCSVKLACAGSEDHCFKATATDGQSTVKGCMSKSICNVSASVGFLQGVSCCSGNLCNGAESVSQSFLFLCGSLLSFILLH